MNLSEGWSCQAYLQNNQIWIRTSLQNVEQYEYHIGPSGTLVELRDLQHNQRDLLAKPTNPNRETDRLWQWSLWNLATQTGALNPSARKTQDPRYNITQAGRDDGVDEATVSAYLVPDTCNVEIFALQTDNWSSANRSHLTGQVASLTRYSLGNLGQLQVQRLLQIGAAYVDGAQTPLKSAYLEAWSPFDASLFKQLALRFDAEGHISQGYDGKKNNVPTYPEIPIEQTMGYAVLLTDAEPTSAVALLFGNRAPCYLDSNNTCDGSMGTRSVLNMQAFTQPNDPNQDMLCIMPGLLVAETLLPNTVVDSHLTLWPMSTVTPQIVNLLESQAADIPISRVLAPSASIPEDLRTDIDILHNNFANSSDTVHTYDVGRLAMDIEVISRRGMCLAPIKPVDPNQPMLIGLVGCNSKNLTGWSFIADGSIQQNNLCLDIGGDLETDAGTAQMQPCRNTPHQTWLRTGDSLRLHNSPWCLDANGWSKKNNVVHLKACDGSSTQQLNYAESSSP